MSIKIADLPDNTNATKVNLIQGSLAPVASHDPDMERFVVYDGNVVLVFNHPEVSAKASMYDMNEGEFDKEAYLKQFDFEDMSEEALAAVSDDERNMYLLEKEQRDKAKEEVIKALDELDFYESGMQVLDTDYDKFMMLYHCREEQMEESEYYEMQQYHISNRKRQINSADTAKEELSKYEEFLEIQSRIDSQPDSRKIPYTELINEVAKMKEVYQ